MSWARWIEGWGELGYVKWIEWNDWCEVRWVEKRRTRRRRYGCNNQKQDHSEVIRVGRGKSNFEKESNSFKRCACKFLPEPLGSCLQYRATAGIRSGLVVWKFETTIFAGEPQVLNGPRVTLQPFISLWLMPVYTCARLKLRRWVAQRRGWQAWSPWHWGHSSWWRALSWHDFQWGQVACQRPSNDSLLKWWLNCRHIAQQPCHEFAGVLMVTYFGPWQIWYLFIVCIYIIDFCCWWRYASDIRSLWLVVCSWCSCVVFPLQPGFWRRIPVTTNLLVITGQS